MSQGKRRLSRALLVSVAVSTLAHGPSNAQGTGDLAAGGPAADSGQPVMLETVVVTAEKRQSDVQNTPLAISAISGEDMRDRQITDFQALSQSLPNVNFGQSTGNARIAIRGVGFDNITVGNEGRVAYHVDGVYLSRPAAALATFFDVDRIEVVRGPQGTLYGRNATGGAINVITQGPTDSLDGYLGVTVGNYGLLTTDAALGGPILDGISGRVAMQTVNRNGYGENLTNGLTVDNAQTRAVRSKVRIEPVDNIDVTLSGDYMKERDHAYGYHYFEPGNPLLAPAGIRFGGTVPADPRDMSSDSGPYNDREFYGFEADVHATFAGLDARSITAYRSSRYHSITDLDATSAPLTITDQVEKSHQFSQEFRLNRDFLAGNWLLGAYYFNENIFGDSAVPLNREIIGLPSLFTQGYFAGGTIHTNAYAVFGQARYRITDALAVSVGGRYSAEKKSIDEIYQFDVMRPYSSGNPVIPSRSNADSHSWSSFTPKGTLEFHPEDGLFFYATISKGFKSGGFNLGGFQAPFKPEELLDYEAGMKADWMGGRLRTNVSAFYYDYTNLQVSKVVGAVIVIENAAKAQVKGIEAEISALPLDNLRIDLNLALLDSRYDEFVTADPARPTLGALDLSGNDLSQAPSYTVNLAGQYTWPTQIGAFSLRGEANWVDRVYFTPFNLHYVSQPAHGMFNAFVNYESNDGHWTGTFFLRNVADKRVIATALVGSSLVGSPVIGTLEPPRTVGVQAMYHF